MFYLNCSKIFKDPKPFQNLMIVDILTFESKKEKSTKASKNAYPSSRSMMKCFKLHIQKITYPIRNLKGAVQLFLWINGAEFRYWCCISHVITINIINCIFWDFLLIFHQIKSFIAWPTV